MATGIKVRMAQVHEVRVTMRGVRLTPDGSPVQVSTRSDFIAPDLSPVSTLDLELDKGLKGWTDTDVKVADNRPKFTDWAKRDLEEFTAGTPIVRKAPANTGRVMNRTGPRR